MNKFTKSVVIGACLAGLASVAATAGANAGSKHHGMRGMFNFEKVDTNADGFIFQ